MGRCLQNMVVKLMNDQHKRSLVSSCDHSSTPDKLIPEYSGFFSFGTTGEIVLLISVLLVLSFVSYFYLSSISLIIDILTAAFGVFFLSAGIYRKKKYMKLLSNLTFAQLQSVVESSAYSDDTRYIVDWYMTNQRVAA